MIKGNDIIIGESDLDGYGKIGTSGLVAPKRDKVLCRYCGGAFEGVDGVTKHESQCREIARKEWTAALLSSPAAADLTPAQIVERVNGTVAAYDLRERHRWVEIGMAGT